MIPRDAKLLCLITLAMLAGSCAQAPTRTAMVVPPVQPPPAEITPSKSPLPQNQTAAQKPAGVLPSIRVAQLISKADALYKQGLKDYQAGKLETSKQEFDAALSVLLESNEDIRGNDRLDAEFEKLVDGTSGIELAAMEDGNTLSAHQYEPSPIESFANLTFPANPNVRLRAQSELRSLRSDLPLVSNDVVDGYLTFLQGSGRDFIGKILRRQERYQPLISKVLQQDGLPQDLIYVAAGESAFNPFAVSKEGARGIWQFMSATARLNGLKINRWVDQRQDPLLSTEAAARDLEGLYHEFGDWYLAMAAYDSGDLTVQRAIERTGYADFWKLRELHALPVETENYVPIFIATALICKDPRAYGFTVDPDPPLRPDQATVMTPTDLRLIADLIGHPVDELVQLNPSLLRWTTPAGDPAFVLNLPPGTKQLYGQGIAAVPPEKRILWRAHTLEAGESLESIAEKYHISIASLERANPIAGDDSVHRGELLILPLPPHRESLSRGYGEGPRRLLRYRIRRGDTLDAIADRFEVSVSEIRRWNHLRGARIVEGQLLRLYVGTRGSSRGRLVLAKSRIITYRVRPGDTLFSIARKFGVEVEELRRRNGLSSSGITVGQRLIVNLAARARSETSGSARAFPGARQEAPLAAR